MSLRVQEFRQPSLEAGALLMQVEMSGICGTDKHTFLGETKQYAGTPAETDTPFPIIQGHENVGVIAEISPTAAERIEFYGRRLAVGDRITMCPDVVCGRCYPCTHVMGYVWCDNSQCYGNSFTSAKPPHLLGGWAEYMYLRPDTFVYKVPSGLSPRVAVLAELMTCTASLDKMKEFSSYAMEGFNSGDTVVVIGSGPLGLLHTAKADMMGAGQIIATDLSSYRLDWARRCGADQVLDVIFQHSRGACRAGSRADRWTRSRCRAAHGEHAAVVRRGHRDAEARRDDARDGQLRRYRRDQHQRPSAHLQQEHSAARPDQSPEHRVWAGAAAARALRRPLPVRRDGHSRVRA